MCTPDIFLGILAILFPPLPVWVKRGICSTDSLINILLLCLGYIPGLLHAWYIIAKYPDPIFEYDTIDQEDGSRVTYVVIQSPATSPPPRQPHISYGTVAPAPQSAPHSAPQQSPNVHANAEGSSSNAPCPPSYAEVVAGDNKIQAP
ncbi:hypothetical protein SAPIO_CDS7377 [Scedosporium apiospermum]|uniref:Stress response RCI peptide n=1 Tax=Pseudallescheria apiosperma TaxID=563466 RepID=A0A084G1S2_PSEDA|nr:uncharacterized protein SAPIO_CDS7377 [Scedosporium apiospermum]KEZ41284.1 hypothetical protein SAPIO_CDS7377 [Scedosporium apiospermum]